MDLRGKVETADTSKLQLCDISLDVKLCFNQNYGSLVVCLIFCGRNAKKYTILVIFYTLFTISVNFKKKRFDLFQEM